MDNLICDITSIKINDNIDIKIDVKLNVVDEKLVFLGKHKTKINGITNWNTFVIEDHDVNNNIDKFDDIIKSIYLKLKKRIDLLHLVNSFLHEVTEIEITDD